MARTVPYLLGCALILSGCVGSQGSGSGATDQPDSTVSAPGDTLPDAATLIGVVLDDSQLPIAGALVGILELGVQATTDEAGAFRFTNLAPGDVTVNAQALGFESAAKRVTLVANEELSVTFLLTSIPIVVPRFEINGPYAGYFTCKLGLPTQSTACGSVLLGGPATFRTDDILWAGDRAFQWWNLTGDDHLTIVGELVWTQGTFATAPKLRSSFDHERFGSHWFCGYEGKNPIYYRYQRASLEEGFECIGNTQSANAEPKEPIPGKPLVTGFRVPFGGTAPPEDPPVYLAFQQKVTSYMSVFYGEGAPDLWHAHPDG